MKGSSLFFIVLLAACNSPQTKKVIHDNKVKILNIEKAKQVKYDLGCDEWQLTTAQAETIMYHLVPATDRDYHNYLDYFQCSMVGNMVRNDSAFRFNINAGAAVALIYQDTVYSIYAVWDSACVKYFLELADSNNLRY